jgi:hypothetical protein
MAEKRIDINAKKVNGEVSTKEHKTSMSIKEIAAKINTNDNQTQTSGSFKDIENTVKVKELSSSIIKNKQYETSKFDTKVKVTLTGFGEEAIPNDANFKRASDITNLSDITLLTPIKSILDSTNGFAESITFILNYARVFTEILQPVETVLIDSSKLLFTTYNAFDNFSTSTSYKRFFTSGALCTDDFCQICPDDDQVATFTKVVKDDYFIQETISKFYNTSKFEQAISTELISLISFKSLSNEFSYSDESYRDVSKVTLEDLNTPEVIVKNYGLNKVNSTSSFTELFVKNINTNYNSQIQNSFDEIQKIDVSKNLLSEKQSDVFDALTVVWDANRLLNSNFSHSDVITKKDVIKGLETIFVSIDTPSIFSEKILLTNNNFVNDNLDPVSQFFRLFNDHVDSTDDFNEIDLDDDQTATFTKVVKDNNETSELLIFDTSTIYNDLSIASEEINNLNFKFLFSEFSQEDLTSINTNKVFLDLFSKNDINLFEVNSAQLSQYTANDLLDRVFNSFRLINSEFTTNTLLSTLVNSFQNSQTTSIDELNRIVNYNKELESLKSTTDNLLFNLNYNLNTVTDPTDQSSFILLYNLLTQYSGIESISNNPKKFLFSESVTLDEILTDIFTLRILEDEHQALDSGLINNQNYFAEAYVEPGYVGTNRTI